MSAALFDPDEFADAIKVLAPLIPDPAKPEPDKPLPLGTRITFTHPLYRRTHTANYRTRKTWEPHPYHADAAKQREGVIVGVRTLANGTRSWEDYGDGGAYEFIPDEHFTAYLIAFDLHRKPVYVRPEHVHPQLTTDPQKTTP